VTDYSDDSSTIRAVLAGDVDAYGRIVKKYQRPIYNLMVRMTHSEQIAMDLAQETFIKAYTALERFKQGRSFFSWIYAIGVNLAKDHARRASRENRCFAAEVEVQHFADDKQPNAEQSLQQRQVVEQLSAALDRLPMEYREAVVLRYRYDCEMKEIAQALSLSVSGAKMRVHRGLRKLEALLTEESDAPA
jgi:RNA polymerase sigma-70 factor, ECF subfamily